ncbi:MAG: hypothetical protein IPF94_09595 [Betaproteobacteria bacterium]|nr:hypothetical protein [Betaproteobacteria bacterium]
MITRFRRVEVACRTGLSEREAAAAGLDAIGVTTEASSVRTYYPGAEPMGQDGRRAGRVAWLGAQIVGGAGAGKRIDVLAAALWNGTTVAEVAAWTSPTHRVLARLWDPVLLAAGKGSTDGLKWPAGLAPSAPSSIA